MPIPAMPAGVAVDQHLASSPSRRWRWPLAGPRRPASTQAAANGFVSGKGKSADCLAEVWQAQAAPDKAFDRAHDPADGGAISCATGTSASQFASALAAIRRAAASGDKAALIAQVALPLLYIDQSGRKRELDRDALAASADEIFSPPVLALLKEIRLEELSTVPQEGAFAELGAVWLAAGRTGGRPRIVTIDRQALAEAAARPPRARSADSGN